MNYKYKYEKIREVEFDYMLTHISSLFHLEEVSTLLKHSLLPQSDLWSCSRPLSPQLQSGPLVCEPTIVPCCFDQPFALWLHCWLPPRQSWDPMACSSWSQHFYYLVCRIPWQCHRLFWLHSTSAPWWAPPWAACDERSKVRYCCQCCRSGSPTASSARRYSWFWCWPALAAAC